MSINNQYDIFNLGYPNPWSRKYNPEWRYSVEYLKRISFDSFKKEVKEVTTAYEKAKNKWYALEERDMRLLRRTDLVGLLSWKYNLWLKNCFARLWIEDWKLKMWYEDMDENWSLDVEIIIDEHKASKTTRRIYRESDDMRHVTGERVGEVVSEESFPLSNSWSVEDSFDKRKDDLLNTLSD